MIFKALFQPQKFYDSMIFWNGGSRVQHKVLKFPQMSFGDRIPDLTPPFLSNPAGRAQPLLKRFSSYSPYFLPWTKNPKSALVEFPGCGLKAILLRVHVAAISSNNVCIVQGANRELCCHHPLEWAVPSDFSGPSNRLRSQGLPKFVPNASIFRSTELLSLEEILQT